MNATMILGSFVWAGLNLLFLAAIYDALHPR